MNKKEVRFFCPHPGPDHGAICHKTGALSNVFSPVRGAFPGEDVR